MIRNNIKIFLVIHHNFPNKILLLASYIAKAATVSSIFHHPNFPHVRFPLKCKQIQNIEYSSTYL